MGKNEIVDADVYLKKLEDNVKSELHFKDLVFEGKIALLFAKHGFKVQMRESPDLCLKINNKIIYAEIKHFREKEQDKIDEINMENAKDELVIIGNTVPTEGLTPWEQVFKVVENKTNQYVKGYSNILVIGSSSPSVDSAIITTVINMIYEHKDRQKFSSLNGIMILDKWFEVSKRRSVHFFPTVNPDIEMDFPELINVKMHGGLID